MTRPTELARITLVFAVAVVGCSQADANGSATSGGKSALAGGGGGGTPGGGTTSTAGSGASPVTTTQGGATSSTIGGAATGGVVGIGGNASTGLGSGGATGGGSGTAVGGATAGASATMSFFVTSDKNTTGNLGGLQGADARCQGLATVVGYGARTWRAYLSAEQDPASGDQPANARDRIGRGPWYNQRGLLVASNLDELHAMKGNPEIFVDEQGNRINGQWVGSPTPNEHDILTGSTATGTLAIGLTCQSWTSSSTALTAQVGHTDGLGPSVNPNPPYDSWNSSHANGSCADTAPKGGAGRIYCFLVN